MWCLRSFCEGLYGLHKTFCGTTKKCESKSLNEFLSSSGIGTGNVNTGRYRKKIHVKYFVGRFIFIFF